jgi:hypothetical protein
MISNTFLSMILLIYVDVLIFVGAFNTFALIVVKDMVSFIAQHAPFGLKATVKIFFSD